MRRCYNGHRNDEIVETTVVELVLLFNIQLFTHLFVLIWLKKDHTNSVKFLKSILKLEAKVENFYKFIR